MAALGADGRARTDDGSPRSAIFLCANKKGRTLGPAFLEIDDSVSMPAAPARMPTTRTPTPMTAIADVLCQLIGSNGLVDDRPVGRRRRRTGRAEQGNGNCRGPRKYK
jgi:hypothetical protein